MVAVLVDHRSAGTEMCSASLAKRGVLRQQRVAGGLLWDDVGVEPRAEEREQGLRTTKKILKLGRIVGVDASLGGADQYFGLHNDGGYAGQFKPVSVFAEGTVFPGVWPPHCDFSEVPGGVLEESTRWGARSCGEGLRA